MNRPPPVPPLRPPDPTSPLRTEPAITDKGAKVEGINPYIWDLPVSAVIAVPALICLLLFSVYIIYLILRRFRALLPLYLSVLFYLVSQLLLLAALSGSWLMKIEGRLECRVTLALETFSYMLPGYCILIITLVRAVFVARPLSYYDYVKVRYQGLALLLSMGLCALLASLPELGVCQGLMMSIRINYRLVPFCAYQEPQFMPSCKTFHGLLLTFGFALPIFSVIGTYTFIYTRAVQARKQHLSLTASSNASSSGGDAKSTEGSQERRTVPWSILAILAISLLTTLPWALVIIYQAQIIEEVGVRRGYLFRVFDVFYAVLQALIGVSPLTYLVTTRSLRKAAVAEIKSLCRVAAEHCPSLISCAE